MGLWWSLAWYLPAVLLLLWAGGRPLVALLQRVGRPLAYFWILAGSGLLFAQLVLPGRAFYPFVAWYMYSEPAPVRDAWAFILVDDAGGQERLSRTWPLLGLDTRALMSSSYGELSRSRAEHGGVPSPEAVERVGELIRVVVGDPHRRDGRTYERVEIRWCEWGGPWPGLEAACFQEDPVGTFSLLSDRGRD